MFEYLIVSMPADENLLTTHEQCCFLCCREQVFSVLILNHLLLQVYYSLIHPWLKYV